MAATAQRRRLSTLLGEQAPIDPRFVPQALPAGVYTRHLSGTIGVTETTGRVFASLCLAKLGRPACTWADAATLLGIDPGAGTDAVHACIGDILCGLLTFVGHLKDAGATLTEAAVDYRAREVTVRALVAKRRWYETWTRRYRPGALLTSRRYALTYLWTIYVGSTTRLSPAWRGRPTATEMGYYRRYAASINANLTVRAALLAVVGADSGPFPEETP